MMTTQIPDGYLQRDELPPFGHQCDGYGSRKGGQRQSSAHSSDGEWVCLHSHQNTDKLIVVDPGFGAMKTTTLDYSLTDIVHWARDPAPVLQARAVATEELELDWVMHGGIFYYGVRKHIYESTVLADKSRMISDALDVFLDRLAVSIGPPTN